jgi:hypothetical protein
VTLHSASLFSLLYLSWLIGLWLKMSLWINCINFTCSCRLVACDYWRYPRLGAKLVPGARWWNRGGYHDRTATRRW